MDVIGQPNGIYLFPTFTGNYNSVNWHITVIIKNNSSWNGWSIYSIKEESNNRMMHIALVLRKLIPHRILWNLPECFEQDEMEFVPLTVCHMIFFIQHIELNKSIKETTTSFRTKNYIIMPHFTSKLTRLICKHLRLLSTNILK